MSPRGMALLVAGEAGATVWWMGRCRGESFVRRTTSRNTDREFRSSGALGAAGSSKDCFGGAAEKPQRISSEYLTLLKVIIIFYFLH